MPNHKTKQNSVLGCGITLDDSFQLSAKKLRFVGLILKTLEANSQHVLNNRIGIHFAKSL